MGKRWKHGQDSQEFYGLASTGEIEQVEYQKADAFLACFSRICKRSVQTEPLTPGRRLGSILATKTHFQG